MRKVWFVRVPLLCATALLAAACQTPDKYYWGHYEDLVYVAYAEPGKIPLELQAQTMEDDLRKAEKAHKPVPPGFHAQLGYVYFQIGNIEAARGAFETEKRLYPESHVLMDRMLTNLAKR